MLDRRGTKRVARKVVKIAESVNSTSEDIAKLEASLSSVPETTDEVRELEEMLSLLEEEIEEGFHHFTDEEILQINQPLEIGLVQQERQTVSTIPPRLDPLEALEDLFAESVAEQMRQESFREQLRWESFDYVTVGTAGLLASVTDFILVGLPSGIQAGPITAWMKSYNTMSGGGREDWFAVLARHLEQVCKVPYDTLKATEAIPGMSGRTHRFQTLGHDPVLGFVYGVLDILRGTVTGFSYDKLKRLHGGICLASPSGARSIDLIEAFLKQIGHLVSDVATPMGLPAPFLTILQAFNTGRFGRDNLALGEVARWMYTHGYDFRHFLSSGFSVGIGKAVLVGLLMLREVTEGGPSFSKLKTQIKYQRMLFAIQSLASLGNAGKIALHQGNPLAINQAQWMTFFRLLGPYLRDQVLQDELALEHLRRMNAEGWVELLDKARKR